jgi:hypothetical protein
LRYQRSFGIGQSGFRVLAAVHAGVLPASCADCNKDPAQRKYWKCEGESETVIWNDAIRGDAYHVCPIRFISENVNAWYQEYAYYKNFGGTAPRYSDLPAIFSDAMAEYEHSYTENYKIGNGKPYPVGAAQNV